ncbi:YlcI/YnfO family protein [Flavonifractor sp. AGMB03687]|uniref:YlcI/YnfO family protein n=1 Tax=Flavonifractor sp. AGMB03687 TaxID=2785133 RepID=UPI001AE03B37|nr:YlcI/YnfO family protein [Flavonifractor sp. AGMB03687]
MAKFKLPAVPGTTSKTIRFPNQILEEVEKAIQGTDCNFSQFVIEATRVALENLKEESDQ